MYFLDKHIASSKLHAFYVFKLCPIFVDSASCLFTKWNNFHRVCSRKILNRWFWPLHNKNSITRQTVHCTAVDIYIILSERFRFHSCHSLKVLCHQFFFFAVRTVPGHNMYHGLRTPREEIAFTARPKIQSQSQIFGYGRSIFCLPHWPNFSDIFDLCLHWVSVVRDSIDAM